MGKGVEDMPFSIPAFNLTAKLWRNPAVVTDAPTRTFSCNLAIGRRFIPEGSATLFFASATTGVQQLLCPKATDITGIFNDIDNPYQDCVEVPADSGCFYTVITVVDVGKGWDNEYRLANICQCNIAVNDLTGNPWMAPLWPIPAP
jgi:hypothetical protein